MKIAIRYLLLCCTNLLLIGTAVVGQNLVENPGFEDYKSIPCEWISNEAELTSIINNWTVPTVNMPHLFCTLSATDCWTYQPNSTFSSNIECVFGNEMPQEGAFMAGVFTYGKNRRSYLQIELKEPLVAGELYDLSMWVSLAENLGFAANGLGMAFHDEEVNFATNGAFDFVDIVLEAADPILTQDGWEQLFRHYLATENYTHLIIGNFTYDVSTETTPLNNALCRSEQAFYFVDNIEVKPTNLQLNVTGPENALCTGEAITLSTSGASNYKWYAASDSSQVIGSGASITIPVDATETYIVKGEIESKELRGEFTVQINPNQTLEASTVYQCERETLSLEVGEYATYLWSTGEVSSRISVDQVGTYTVTVTDDYTCEFTTSFDVLNEALPAINFQTIPSLCYQESAVLEVAQNGFSYLWDDGSTSQNRTIYEAGEYVVTVSNEAGCSKVLEAEITNQNCVCKPLIPNAFTPNGDGLNDLFTARIPCPINTYTFKVFDRWGKPVFESDDPSESWDGYDEEINQRMGVYAWLLVYEDVYGKVYSERGNVTLLR